MHKLRDIVTPSYAVENTQQKRADFLSIHCNARIRCGMIRSGVRVKRRRRRGFVVTGPMLLRLLLLLLAVIRGGRRSSPCDRVTGNANLENFPIKASSRGANLQGHPFCLHIHVEFHWVLEGIFNGGIFSTFFLPLYSQKKSILRLGVKTGGALKRVLPLQTLSFGEKNAGKSFEFSQNFSNIFDWSRQKWKIEVLNMQ